MSWTGTCQERKGLFAVIGILLTAAAIMLYKINRSSVSIETNNSSHATKRVVYATLPAIYSETFAISEDEFNDDDFGKLRFDINGSDVMVFLHMQKTGGTTFGRHLVKNLRLAKQCDLLEQRKRRSCLRPNSDIETWLFSRVSTGWRCGLHSDWTELDECVDGKLNEIEKQVKKRRYFEVTILRNPVDRYLSEYHHVHRGATWKKTRYSCDHRDNTIPRCFRGKDWRGVSLDDFMSCPYNMGANRQTRMLANLRLVNCYERWINRNLTREQVSDLESTMLKSAKENLKSMTFFGLTEEQVKMQALFEYAFPLKFKKDFFQYNETHITGYPVSDDTILAIKRLNHLDMELYYFARRLFDFRYKKFVKAKPTKKPHRRVP